MKAKNMAKSYAFLTGEERFRLIAAARARGDEAEQERLARSGKQIELITQDHAPFAFAFKDVAMLYFLEVLDHVLRYLDLLPFADSVERYDDEGNVGQTEEEADDKEGANGIRQRLADFSLLAGFILRAKLEGWKLFCRGLNVSPFLLWEKQPAYQRLQRAMAHVEQRPLSSEEFLFCLNALQPVGSPPLTAVPYLLTAEGTAAVLEQVYCWRVQSWGG